jgi:phosphatidylglycerophosphatase A
MKCHPVTMKIPVAETIATWFYCGYVPKGPGTAGALGALLFLAPVVYYLGFSHLQVAIFTLFWCGMGVWASNQMIAESHDEDPQFVVIDEVVGQWLALLGANVWSPLTWLLAFAYFRLFDIVKPFPVRHLERLPKGWGVMMDDVGAGVLAAIALGLTERYLLP